MTGQLSGVCRNPAGALTGVRSGADIGILSVRLSISQGMSLGDFLLAPAFVLEKVALWEGFLYLTSGSESTAGMRVVNLISQLSPAISPLCKIIQTRISHKAGHSSKEVDSDLFTSR